MLTAAARWRVRVGCVYPGQGARRKHKKALDDPAYRLGFTAHVRVCAARHLIERNLCRP